MKFQKFLFSSLATPYQWNLLISAILFVFMFYVLFEHLNVSKIIPSWIDMDKYIRVLWGFVRWQTRFTWSSNILQKYGEQIDFIYIQIKDIWCYIQIDDIFKYYSSYIMNDLVLQGKIYHIVLPIICCISVWHWSKDITISCINCIERMSMSKYT